MTNFKAWIKALRAHFLTATLAPVLLGTTIAWYDVGGLNIIFFILALIGVSSIHLGANLVNDYFDYKSGNDDVNVAGSHYSGGSRVIQEGLISPKSILIIALLFFFFGSLIGFYFLWVLKSIEILVIGLIGVFIGFFYTANPLKLGYRGFAEICNGVIFGPLIGLGAYYVQTQTFSTAILLTSVIVGLLLALVLIINEFPDYPADKTVGKRTLLVCLGREKSVKIFHFGIILAYFILTAGCILEIIPIASLVAFLSLPFAISAIKESRENFDKPQKIIKANISTFFLHISFSLLLCLGILLDRVLL
jgi:1,4-dihydroxy-2-naphthoate polyprenyltransferase